MKTNDYDPVANLYDIYIPATFDIDFFINETGKSQSEVLELMSRTGRDEFEELAKAAGFKVRAFYGDYDCAEFTEENSPFMIWLLESIGG